MSKTKKAEKPSKKVLIEAVADYLKEAVELLNRIETAEKDCQAGKNHMDEIKDRYKEARGYYQTCVLNLRTLCRARSESHPLFDQPKEQGGLKADPPAENRAVTGNWRDLPIADLISNASLQQKLIDNGINTIGKLSDHIAEQGEWWRKQLIGIGEVAAKKISDAFVSFWAHHPEFCESEIAVDTSSERAA